MASDFNKNIGADGFFQSLHRITNEITFPPIPIVDIRRPMIPA